MPTRPPIYRPPFTAPPPSSDAVRGSASARGYDRDWAALRASWLTEHPTCHNCGRLAVIVDHRVPIQVDPSRRLDRTNLRSCCVDCHNKITANFRTTGVNELPKEKR
jgi:5-methylcytosine-specific restriction endonuclease McrA